MKGLETLEKIHDHWNCCNPNSNGCDEEDFKVVEKELKVLEIIKDKNVAITMIKQTNTLFEYTLFTNEFNQIKRVDEDKYKLSPQQLTPEEYDLLKEVLL